MKRISPCIIPGILNLCCLLIFFSCSNNHNSTSSKTNKADSSKTKNVSPYTKPSSSYNDTLKINTAAAVFYYPDSLQLQKIKQLTDSVMYVGNMHEYFYAVRNAHTVIKNTWPMLHIIEAKKIRYLLFVKKDGARECIDLNNHNDFYGLFVFDGTQSPLLVDMTNIESQVSFYLKN